MQLKWNPTRNLDSRWWRRSDGSSCSINVSILDGGLNPVLSEYAWYCANNDNHYGSQGVKEAGMWPNGFGLYDMHGNLMKWAMIKSVCLGLSEVQTLIHQFVRTYI